MLKSIQMNREFHHLIVKLLDQTGSPVAMGIEHADDLQGGAYRGKRGSHVVNGSGHDITPRQPGIRWRSHDTKTHRHTAAKLKERFVRNSPGVHSDSSHARGCNEPIAVRSIPSVGSQAEL